MTCVNVFRIYIFIYLMLHIFTSDPVLLSSVIKTLVLFLSADADLGIL